MPPHCRPCGWEDGEQKLRREMAMRPPACEHDAVPATLPTLCPSSTPPPSTPSFFLLQWMTSQVIMHLLESRASVVPILVRVEQLQTRISEIEGEEDWVDAYLRLTCEAAHYRFLRSAMEEGRAVHLLDGLDEAGSHREKIERHVSGSLSATPLLCTSRPAGLTEGCFSAFHTLKLAPLTDAQQADFLARRLDGGRAEELRPYLLEQVPVEADTQLRVSSNPLLLSMIASIADLRKGIGMPTTTAELYDVAAEAMLSRSAERLSDAGRRLLRATFFEAHSREQRVITEEHVAEAARRVGAEAGELTRLVGADRLPLLRLLRAEPLQMQAFHLSFQEYYAMLSVREDGAPLPGFEWGVWWSNAVLMGVQTGDAFGRAFVQATGLAVEADRWRHGLVHSLVRKALPSAWLPTVVEAAGGRGSDAAELKAFVGRHREVLKKEGGKAVAQLALQEPDCSGVVIRSLREHRLHPLLRWRNKPRTVDPCVATYAHPSGVESVSVSRTRIVCGAGKTVYVYDSHSEELLGELGFSKDVKSVCLFEEEGAGMIVAAGEKGTIKVWDSGT